MSSALKNVARNDRILLVDDHDVLLRALCKLVEHDGYHCARATCGTSAMAIAASWSPSVVIFEPRIQVRQLGCHTVSARGQESIDDFSESSPTRTNPRWPVDEKTSTSTSKNQPAFQKSKLRFGGISTRCRTRDESGLSSVRRHRQWIALSHRC